ncbi:alpha/beta fold hydrolase [Kribbella sp. NPDC020789]
MIDIGDGPAIVLLHGFPHTFRLWERVAPQLAEQHRVIAPDLVAGGSALELASRIASLLDGLGIERATMVGIDAGVQAALGFALSRPRRTEALVVMEAVLPGIAGAENFSPPWWFGFHQAPELAERVLGGHEREYVEWFLRAGTADQQGIGADITDAFVAAYTGRSALAAAFEHYRALPRTATELNRLLPDRLTLPVLAVGAHPVGSTLANQLAPYADDLTTAHFDSCGHLIPLDAPERLLAELIKFQRP